MSIIYEALKKVEKLQLIKPGAPAQDQPKQPDGRKRIKLMPVAIYIIALAAGIFIANIIFTTLTRKSATRITQKTQQPAAALPSPATAAPLPAAAIKPPEPPVARKSQAQSEELVLNGLFFSENTGYVLINNRILKEGDEINGAIVKRITLEGAELESAGGPIKLSNTK